MSCDKNHNPRKGTEIAKSFSAFVLPPAVDKNHNPRKGTEMVVFSYRCNEG